MKSNLEGCVRMCETCPKRALEAMYMDPEIISQIWKDITEGRDHQGQHFPEIDPLDLDKVTTNHIGELADYGKKDIDTVDFLTFSRQRSTGSTLPFPLGTTLEMIGACTGPEKIKRGLFRSSMRCGAYQQAMQAVADTLADYPDSLAAYTEFLENQDAKERRFRAR